MLGSSKAIELAVTESETTHKTLIDAHPVPYYDGADDDDDDDDDGDDDDESPLLDSKGNLDPNKFNDSVTSADLRQAL